MVQTGQRRRWISALPARFGSADPKALPPLEVTDEFKELLPPEVVSTSVQYVRRPAQLLATRAIKKIPSNELVISTALELAAAAEADGYRVVKREGRPVVMQISGDSKYGFNKNCELAMSTWLSVPDFLREEAVGVVLEEGREGQADTQVAG